MAVDIGAIQSGGQSVPSTVSELYVNCGGESFAAEGKTFVADYGFNAGVTNLKTGDVLGTTDDTLYLSLRRLPTNEISLLYRFDDSNTPPENGIGTVTLYFMESFWTDNSRAFNIDVQGNRVETDFRPYDEAGGGFTAVTKSYPATVTDNTLTVEFTHGTGADTKPEVMAIKWVLDSAGDPVGAETLPIRIACGVDNGGIYFGNTFEDDRNYTPSALAYVTADAISGTTEDALYQKGRRPENNNAVLDYTFTIPTTTVDVILHFAETFFTSSGSRVFDIDINGVLLQNNYDIYADVGHDVATTKTYQVTTINQADNLIISLDALTASGGNDKGAIAGIEIVEASPAPSIAPPNPDETADSATQITVTHDPVTGATGYDYEIRLPNDTLVDNDTIVYSGTDPGYIFTGLTEYTEYKWRARATNANGDGPWGSYRTKFTLDETAPSVPSGNSASAIDSQSVEIQSGGSTDSMSGISAYILRENGGLFEDTVLDSFPSTKDGLSAATLYTMTLAAVDNEGNESAESATFQATTGTDSIPDVPLNPSAAPLSETALSLGWEESLNATGYRVYHVPPSVAFDTLIIDQAATSYAHTGLSSWETHYYKVSAWNAMGESEKSAAFSARTLDITAPVGGSINAVEQVGATAVFDITPATDAGGGPAPGGGSGVAGYNLLNNSVLYDIITDANPQADISFTGATYTWTIEPFDAAGNVGTESAAVELVALSTYPDYPQSYENDREPLDQVLWDRANGTLRGRVLHTKENYEFTIVHPYITDAQRQILDNFWTQNRGVIVNLVLQDTGEAHQCYMRRRPKFIPISYDGTDHLFKAIVEFIQ